MSTDDQTCSKVIPTKRLKEEIIFLKQIIVKMKNCQGCSCKREICGVCSNNISDKNIERFKNEIKRSEVF